MSQVVSEDTKTSSLTEMARYCQKAVSKILGIRSQNFYFRGYNFNAKAPESLACKISFNRILHPGVTTIRINLEQETQGQYDLHVLELEDPCWKTIVPILSEIIDTSQTKAFYVNSCQVANDDPDILEIEVSNR